MAKPTTTVLLVVVVATAALLMTEAAVSAPAPSPSGGGGDDCVSGLMTCASALNGTRPSSDCCKAMETAMKTQLTCLCGLFEDPQFLATFNLTPQKALQIPQRCGLKAGPSLCSAVKASSPKSGAQAPNPGSPSSNNGAGAKLAGSGLYGMFLLMIPMMYY